MPRDIEHIVETHRIARQRIAEGKPVWDRRVNVADVWRDEALTFEQRRDAVVARLRTSAWLAGRNAFDPLVEAVDGLAAADDGDEFDGWWDEVYDHADYDRVWIATC